MTDKEKEAIEILNGFDDGYTFQECTSCFKFNEKDSCCNKEKCDELRAIETVLNLIEKQQAKIKEIKKQKHNQSSLRRLNERKMRKYRTENKGLKAEIEKKDKMIDLMAEQLRTPVNSKEWVIEYYKKKVEDK